MAQIQKPGATTQPQARPKPGDHPGETGATAAPQSRILRIGIVQGGKIVEERLIRKRVDVSIGQSVKNTFVVPASNLLPANFMMFELAHGQYHLNFTDGMDGRIATEGEIQTLIQLRGKAQKKGAVYHLPLA